MTLVVVAALTFQCTATWKWLMEKACSKTYSTEDDCTNKQQATIQISNSLPDLPEQVKPINVQEIKDAVAKKVRTHVKTNFDKKFPDRERLIF